METYQTILVIGMRRKWIHRHKNVDSHHDKGAANLDTVESGA